MAIGKASQRRHTEQEPERWRRRQPAWATRRVGLSWFLPTGHHGCLFSSSCFLSKEIGLPEQRPVIIITSFEREPGLTHHTELRSIGDGLLAPPLGAPGQLQPEQEAGWESEQKQNCSGCGRRARGELLALR